MRGSAGFGDPTTGGRILRNSGSKTTGSRFEGNGPSLLPTRAESLSELPVGRTISSPPAPWFHSHSVIRAATGAAGASYLQHIVLCVHITLRFAEISVAKRIKDLTTIQFTTQTRDRLYRLQVRKTYDEVLIEFCDLYDRSGHSGQ